MSFLDTLGKAAKAVGSGLNAVGEATLQPFLATSGFVVDIASAPWQDAQDNNHFLQALNRAGDWGMNALGVVGHGLDAATGGYAKEGISELGHGLHFATSYGISRPIATAVEAFDPDLPGARSVPGLNWREAWNASRDISPGQAITRSIFGAAGSAGGPLQAAAKAIEPRVSDPNFDITSPADRQAFRQWGPAKLVSGTADFWLSWNVSSEALAGKALASAHTAALVRPVVAEGTRVGPKAGPQDFVAKHSTPRQKTLKATDTTAAAASSGPNAVLTKLEGMDSAARAEYLSRNSTLVGPRASDDGTAIITLLSEPKVPGGALPDAEEMRAVLRYAMDPDPRSKSVLAAMAEKKAAEVEVIGDVRIPALERSLGEMRNPVNDAISVWSEREAGRRAGLLADANAAYKLADAEAQHLDFLTRAAGSLRNVPRETLNSRVGTTWALYQPSKYMAPMRVLKSASTMRAGVVDLNRPAEGMTQIGRMLDRAGHAFEARPWHLDLTSRVGLSTRSGGLDPELVGALKLRYARATTEADKMTAIEAAESAVIEHYAAKVGISEKVAKEIIATAHLRRLQVRPYYEGAPRFSGAPKDASAVRGQGPYLDQKVGDEIGEAGTAVLETQLRNVVPLLDVDGIAKIMHSHQASLIADEGGIVAGLRGMRGASPTAARRPGSPVTADPWAQRVSSAVEFGAAGSEEVLHLLNRLWKPSQLMRLGWTMRVITDEQLRIIAAVGAMTHLSSLAESLSHPNALRAEHFEGLRTELADLEAKLLVPQANPAQVDAMRRRVAELEATVAPRPALPDSVVRGADGELLRVYHGTGADFAGFDDAATTRLGARADFGPGHYFTTDPNYASAYARGDAAQVRMAYLDMKKVWSWREDTLGATEARRIARALGHEGEVGRTTLDELKITVGATRGVDLQRFNIAVRDMLEARGYQGIALDGLEGGAKDYVAFRAASVHSPHLAPTLPSEVELARLASLRGELADLESKAARGGEWDPLESARAKAIRRELGKRRADRTAKFAGELTSTDRLGRKVTYGDALAGEEGRVFSDLASSSGGRDHGGAFAELAGANGRLLSDLRAGRGDAITILPHSSSVISEERAANDAAYALAWERSVNDQIGQSEIGRRMLQGQSDAEITTWLQRSKEGRALRKRLPLRGHDPERWVGEVRQHVDHYLPPEHPELRALALDGRARVTHLNEAQPSVFLRPEVHGESLRASLGTSEIMARWDSLVEKTYRNLGARPTNNLSRHPHFASLYRNEMAAQIHAYSVAEHETIPGAAIEAMQRKARERALAGVRNTLYELSSQSNLAHAFRYISPFYSAWQEALTRWGLLFMEDPSRLAHMVQMWESPSKMGIVKTDPDTGQQSIVVGVPPFMRKALGGAASVDIPKYWMRDLIAQGTYWMSPGVGVPVAVPLGAYVRSNPDQYANVKFLLPYGAGADWQDQLLPAAGRRFRSLVEKEGDPAYAQALVRISQDLETDRRLGKIQMTDDQMMKAAYARADQFFLVRTFANLGLPFSPTFKSKYDNPAGKSVPEAGITEMDGYVEGARRLRDAYLRMPGGKDGNGKNWEERYLEIYGKEYFAFTASASKSNTGIAPTVSAWKASKEFSDLITEAPEFGGLIVGPEANSGDFSSEVYKAQFTQSVGPGSNETFRDRLSPKQALESTQVSQGWDSYVRFSHLIDAELGKRSAKGGPGTIGAAANRDLAVLKKAYVGKLAQEFPAWDAARNAITPDKTGKLITFLDAHAQDPRFTDRPGWSTLKQYLTVRKAFAAELDRRYRAGGGATLTHPKNADLAALWDAVTGRLVDSDVAFGTIYHRWLTKDLGGDTSDNTETAVAAG